MQSQVKPRKTLQKRALTALRKGDFSLLADFIKSGIDPNFEYGPKTKDTLITWAVKEKSCQGIEILINAGADMNKPRFHGQTPLILSCMLSYGAIAKILIKSGADVDKPDVYGRTALMAAVARNNIELARELIEAGANPNALDNSGHSAPFYATKKLKCVFGSRSLNDFQTYIDFERNRETQHCIFEELERFGCDISIKDKFGRKANQFQEFDLDDNTPLIQAIYKGDIQMAAIILENGDHIEERSDLSSWTPLLTAARIESIDFVKFLLEHGANPNAKTGHDSTAIGENALNVVIGSIASVLLRSKIDKNKIDQFRDVVIALLMAGASAEIPEQHPMIVLKLGKTPREILEKVYPDIFDHLGRGQHDLP